MLRRVLAVACALALVAFSAGCSSGGDKAATGASNSPLDGIEPAPVRVGVLPVEAALPLWAAERDGVFKDAGLDVTIVPYDTAAERDAALASGQIDAFLGDVPAAARLESSGVAVAVVSAMTSAEATGAPESAGKNMDGSQMVLGVSDAYLAMPSSLIAVRSLLDAWDEAAEAINADPDAYRDLLAEHVRDTGGAGSAPVLAPRSSAPDTATVEATLSRMIGDGELADGISVGDLVLDLRR